MAIETKNSCATANYRLKWNLTGASTENTIFFVQRINRKETLVLAERQSLFLVWFFQVQIQMEWIESLKCIHKLRALQNCIFIIHEQWRDSKVRHKKLNERKRGRKRLNRMEWDGQSARCKRSSIIPGPLNYFRRLRGRCALCIGASACVKDQWEWEWEWEWRINNTRQIQTKSQWEKEKRREDWKSRWLMAPHTQTSHHNKLYGWITRFQLFTNSVWSCWAWLCSGCRRRGQRRHLWHTLQVLCWFIWIQFCLIKTK